LLAIVQARSNSRRFPKKVLANLVNKPVIQHVVDRLKKSKYIKKIIVATSSNSSDDELVKFLKNIKCNIFRGSLNNVAKRFLEASKNEIFFLRISGDSPLIDPKIVDRMIKIKKKKKFLNYDIITNIFPKTFPNGQSVEIVKREIIKKNLYRMSKDEKEHVTKFFYKNYDNFKIKNYTTKRKYRYTNLVVDYRNDLKFLDQKMKKNNL
jgi:spore coat polysaccharide biosynthesis protein SpsF